MFAVFWVHEWPLKREETTSDVHVYGKGFQRNSVMECLPNKRNISHCSQSSHKITCVFPQAQYHLITIQIITRLTTLVRGIPPHNPKCIFDPVTPVMSSSDICFQCSLTEEWNNIKHHLFACTMNGWKSQEILLCCLFVALLFARRRAFASCS